MGINFFKGLVLSFNCMDLGYFNSFAEQMGLPVWFFLMIVFWTISWKLVALWTSARKGSVFWFILLAFLNTIGVLEILYIFLISKMDYDKKLFSGIKKKHDLIKKKNKKIVKK